MIQQDSNFSNTSFLYQNGIPKAFHATGTSRAEGLAQLQGLSREASKSSAVSYSKFDDFRQINDYIAEARQQVFVVTSASIDEPDVVYDLRPLYTRSVVLRVGEAKTAPFIYRAEDDYVSSDIEE